MLLYVQLLGAFAAGAASAGPVVPESAARNGLFSALETKTIEFAKLRITTVFFVENRNVFAHLLVWAPQATYARLLGLHLGRPV